MSVQISASHLPHHFISHCQCDFNLCCCPYNQVTTMRLQQHSIKCWFNFFSHHIWTCNSTNLLINDTLPPIGLAQDCIPLCAWTLHAMCSAPTPPPAFLLSSDVFSGVFGTSAMTKNNETVELASQEKIVETGASCKVKRVFEPKKKRGKNRSHAVLHQGRRVHWQGCCSSWRKVSDTVKLSFLGRKTTL